MKLKRKIIAIATVLLLLAIPLSIVEAREQPESNKNEIYKVEILTVKSDGKIKNEEIPISDADFAEFEAKISQVMDEIPTVIGWESLLELIKKIFGQDNPFLGNIFEMFSKLKIFGRRGFVISSGHGYDLSPLKRMSFKIRKTLGFWYYDSNQMIDSKTIIVKPLALKMETLSGGQIGYMTGFTGVYFKISRGFLKESYTFFMGTARHINGFDFIPKF